MMATVMNGSKDDQQLDLQTFLNDHFGKRNSLIAIIKARTVPTGIPLTHQQPER